MSSFKVCVLCYILCLCTTVWTFNILFYVWRALFYFYIEIVARNHYYKHSINTSSMPFSIISILISLFILIFCALCNFLKVYYVLLLHYLIFLCLCFSCSFLCHVFSNILHFHLPNRWFTSWCASLAGHKNIWCIYWYKSDNSYFLLQFIRTYLPRRKTFKVPRKHKLLLPY